MKKLIMTVLLVFSTLTATAQNLVLEYSNIKAFKQEQLVSEAKQKTVFRLYSGYLTLKEDNNIFKFSLIEKPKEIIIRGYTFVMVRTRAKNDKIFFFSFRQDKKVVIMYSNKGKRNLLFHN